MADRAAYLRLVAEVNAAYAAVSAAPADDAAEREARLQRAQELANRLTDMAPPADETASMDHDADRAPGGVSGTGGGAGAAGEAQATGSAIVADMPVSAVGVLTKLGCCVADATSGTNYGIGFPAVHYDVGPNRTGSHWNAHAPANAVPTREEIEGVENVDTHAAWNTIKLHATPEVMEAAKQLSMVGDFAQWLHNQVLSGVLHCCTPPTSGSSVYSR